jgi:AraC family ethanolamine operon transcriptional activator
MLTSPFFEANDLAMPESSLNALCETLGIADLDALVGDAEMVSCDPKALDELRNKLGQIDVLLREQPSLVGTPEIRGIIEVEVPTLILDTLLSAPPRRNYPSSLRKGRRCVDRVKEYVKAHSHEEVTLADMCKVAGVSARTLQYQFETLLKVTPKQYLKIQRLNNAHKWLFASSPTETKVVDIANHCGFWHMGQFAADYRQLFGELPSATLKR